jgi:hypothetical protein
MGATHVDDGNEQKRVEICEELLKRYREEGVEFVLNIVTGDESWIHHFDLEEKTTLHAIQAHFISSPKKKFKTVPSAGKILLTAFWDSQSLHDRMFGSWEYTQFSSVH